MVTLSPSILSADFANLERDIKIVSSAGVKCIHVDVMDGNFVDNITIGAPVVKSIRKATNRILDVHLMIREPEKYIDSFIEAGADIITVHHESDGDIIALIRKIKAAGLKAGIALSPATSLSILDLYYSLVDLVLVMTVEPGFGGQELLGSCLTKIRGIRSEINENNYKCLISADGGINLSNVKDVIEAGANIIISGSSVYDGVDAAANCQKFFKIFEECGTAFKGRGNSLEA